MIRPVELDDVPTVVRMQLDQLPGSLPNELGRRFLETYYRVLLEDPSFVCNLWLDEGCPVAFVAWSADASRAFSNAIRRHPIRLGLSVLQGLLERPSRLRVLLRVLQMLAPGHREPGHEVSAEILSMAVLPEFRRRGIAHQLVRSFVESMDRAGVLRAKAVTKTEERDEKINRFFQSFGFRFVQRMVRNGQELNLLVRTRPSG